MAVERLPSPIPHADFMPGFALETMLQREVDPLLYDLPDIAPGIVTEADFVGLPAPVQRYLRAANIIGKQRTLFMRARMRGDFRRGADQKWMPMICEQYNRMDQPARMWYAMMKFMPFLTFYVRDVCQRGQGVMYAHITPWLKVLDEHGPEITQGEMLVFLNDMVFAPSALLNDYIHWEALDDRSARAHLVLPGLAISAVFHFNDDDDVVNFVAERYQTVGKSFVLHTWSTPFWDHREVNGVRMPTRAEAIWKMPTGAFSYARIALVDVRHNVFTRYA
jgi:hypothetical protein